MSKKVLVTGSSGLIGRFVVPELRDCDYEVTCTDLNPAANQGPTIIADLTDLGQVVSVLAGHDAVIHLAAIPSPRAHPPDVVFRTNVMSTFNVLEAAVTLGINRLVLASSLAALGFAYRFRDFSPRYVPIDDAHPLLPQDVYGLSKQIGETLADGYARRNPALSITSLRFTTVIDLEAHRQHLDAMRARPHTSTGFWGYVDVRDAALACRLALEHGAPGHDAFLIAAPETYMDVPTLELLNRFYPGVARVAEGFGGRMGVLDCSRAEQVLGFTPRYR